MTEIQTYYLQLHTHTHTKVSQKEKHRKHRESHIYREKKEWCKMKKVPEMKVEGEEEEETGRSIKRKDKKNTKQK